MTTHYVYRLLGMDGGLLYVGCTADLAQRLRGHSFTKAWWPEVGAYTVERFDDKASALNHERILIEMLDPPHNVRFTVRQPVHFRRALSSSPRHSLRRGVSAHP